MSVSTKWVGKVKAAVADIQEAQPGPRETARELRRAFELYEYNAGLAPITQSPRARAEREIHRIALTYGWQSEVARFLDRHDATTVGALDEDAAEQLLARMRQLLDRAMNACDSDEALPAR